MARPVMGSGWERAAAAGLADLTVADSFSHEMLASRAEPGDMGRTTAR